MPLPVPNDNEKQPDFVSRCMGSEVMNKEYPDQKQRAAICYSQYKRRKLSKGNEEPDWAECETDQMIIFI